MLLTRSLPQAWALATKWRELEPNIPHLALPPKILLAMLALCVCWGWPRALCTLWAMFLACLRPVEGYEARFAHISLPQDRLEADVGLVYIYVYAPKTKWIAARKQYARFVDHEFVSFCAALRHFAGDRLQRVFVGGLLACVGWLWISVPGSVSHTVSPVVRDLPPPSLQPRLILQRTPVLCCLRAS